MFGFRKVGPPLTTFQRVDIELLMRKTIETVGKEVLETDVVTELGQLQLDTSDASNWLESASLEIARRMRMADADLQIDVVAGADLGYPSKYQPTVDQSGRSVSSTNLCSPTIRSPIRFAR